MVNGTEYAKVLEITDKAEHMGLKIVPPYSKQTIIERSVIGNDFFKVLISEMRYPTIQNVIVHEGNFPSVEVFILGAYFLHASLIDLGIITEDNVLVAAQHFILMDTIRHSGN